MSVEWYSILSWIQPARFSLFRVQEQSFLSSFVNQGNVICRDFGERERQREGQRQRQSERQTERDRAKKRVRDRHRERLRERERERERERIQIDR